MDGGFGSVGGDAAVAAADLDGDGRQELVRASGCRESAAASLDLCLSYFTPGAAPGDPGYSEEFGTGLSVDASGVGRVRVAAGPLGLASARVTSAEFGVDAAQESTVATFTTAGRHGFAVGEPVRLGNDAGLQAALCVESPLSQEGVQCIGQDLLSYHPVTAVTATSFSVDLGVLVVARAGVGRVVTPRPWSAGCVSCGVRAEAVSTGVAVAWTAPTGSLRLAVFSVVSGEVGSGPGFELVDVRTVGRLFTDTTTGVPARESFSLVIDDFAVGGPDEVAVAFGAECGAALPCPRVSFLALDDAKRLALLSSGSFGGGQWCQGPLSEPGSGSMVDPGQWGLLSVVLASGRFRSGAAGQPAAGADLAIGWVGLSGERAATYHAFQTFDVSPQLGLVPTTPLDPGAGTADPGACATVTARLDDDPEQALRSGLQVAAADLDGQFGDELVVAETMPPAPTPTVEDPAAPVAVSVWGQAVEDQPGLGWRPQSRLQPATADDEWAQPFPATPTTAPTTALGDPGGYQAVGEDGAGQVSLTVGRLARRQAAATDDLAYPNAVNPDVVVGWTCDGTTTCGRSTPDTAGVAIDAVAVAVDGNGIPTLVRQSGPVMSERPGTIPTSDAGAHPERLDRTYLQVVTADVNGDSPPSATRSAPTPWARSSP